jgi:predicted permease
MPHTPRRQEHRVAAAFRALLSLYPGTFRDEYGRELNLLFVDRYRDASSVWERATLWLDVLTGLAVEVPKEHCRMIVQDLRSALRSLRKHALVTLTIVVTLGLGIGANAALFSLLNAVVLRSLPVPSPDQLFGVRAAFPLASGNRFSGPMVERLRESAPQGVAVAAMSRVARGYTRLEGESGAEPAAVQLVSSSYFPVLGIEPAIGRALPEEQGLAPMPVAVVSHRYWQRRFGGTTDAVGRTLIVNGTTFTIVGVAPEGFPGVWLESPVDLWVPLTMDRAVKYSQNYSMDGANRNAQWLSQERIWWLDVIVQAPPDRAAAAAAALDSGVRAFAKDDARISFEPFGTGFSTFRRQFEAPLFVLVAMAGLVMLIACANVANLLLARAAGRQRELAVRMSLGARRARLMHQLLMESVLLVLLAGGAALLFARWSTDFLIRTATAASGVAPFAAAIDVRVWMFTAAVVLLSLVFFAVLPAWRTTRLDLAAAIRTGGRGTVGPSATRPGRLLVIVQVALSLVLVTATALLVRSFHNLLTVDVGFDRGHLVSVVLEPALAGGQATEPRPGEVAALQQRVLDSVAALPGVSSASLAMCGLHGNCAAREDGIRIEGYAARPDEQVVFLVNAVSANYFSTLGTRLLAGRPFSDADSKAGPTIAIVNRALADKYFTNGQAVGRRFGGGARLDTEIVGIVDDARLLSVKEAAIPTVYFSLAQRTTNARALEVRVSGEPRLMVASIRAAITQAAPGMPIESIAPIDERISRSLGQVRVMVFLASGFGALALGLAGFGLFGLLSYAVARRASEFGIRMALGGSRSQVLWSVVREALVLVLCGVILGAPIVMAGGRYASSLVFGVSPNDWATFLGATLTLLIVAAACTALPALRASRVDPLIALRQE